jgi:proteasome lid subunit RPN8/RPN11
MKFLSTLRNRLRGEKVSSPLKTIQPTQAATENLDPPIAPEQSPNGNTAESIEQVEPIVEAGAEGSVDQTNQPVDKLESLAEAESTEPVESTKVESSEVSAQPEVQAEEQQPQELQTEGVAPQVDDKQPVESPELEHAVEAEASDDGSSKETAEPTQTVVAEVAEEEQQAEPKSRIRILVESSETDDEKADALQPELQRAGILPESYLSRGASLFQCKDEERRRGDCDVLMLQSVYREINKHLSEDTSREYGGLLLGIEVQSFDPDTPSILITHSLRAKYTDGNSARLTFTVETWSEFNQQTDDLRKLGANLRRLGWYHSHPNHGIFLSHWDLNVCADFNRPTQVALVVDPIRNEGGFFVHGRSGYRSRPEQGFWELQDLQPESVVTWRNVRRVTTRTDRQPILIPPQTSDGTLRSDDTEHLQTESGYKNDSWTAGGTEGGELAQDSPIIRRAAYIDDEDQPVIRLQHSTHARESSNMPPWIFLLVAVLLPTTLAILALRSLSNLHQEIAAMEQSLDTLTQNLSNLETKVREVSVSRSSVEPSSSPVESSPTSGTDAPAVGSRNENRARVANSGAGADHRQNRPPRVAAKPPNKPSEVQKETHKTTAPATKAPTPKPTQSN